MKTRLFRKKETDHTEMFNGFEVRYFAGSGMAEFEVNYSAIELPEHLVCGAYAP